MLSIQLWKNYGATIMAFDGGWEFVSTEKLHKNQLLVDRLWIMNDKTFKGLIDRLGIDVEQAVELLV